MSGENINDLKKTYIVVKKAVYSIPPQYRERATLCLEKTVCIKQAQQHIMNIIKTDLHVETLPKKLTKKLESVFNTAKFKSTAQEVTVCLDFYQRHIFMQV